MKHSDSLASAVSHGAPAVLCEVLPGTHIRHNDVDYFDGDRVALPDGSARHYVVGGQVKVIPNG